MQTDPSHPAGCMVAFDALPGASDSAELKALTTAAEAANRAAIAACVRAGVESHELPANVDEAALAALFDALLTGFSVQILDGVSSDKLEGAITAALMVWEDKRFPT